MKKRALFLINPISGIGKQKTIESLVKTTLDTSKLSADITYTRYHGHARELTREAADQYDIVVAVGGDGTVNEVGSALLGSETALAIIPTGSGNGLARHLQVPLKVDRAVKLLNHLNFKMIDTLKVNDHASLNVAGVGFDAYISHLFAKKKQRGPLAYLKLITTEYSKYKAAEYTILIDDDEIKLKAFLISFANSSQYGNNIYIAPQAEIDDGFMDVSLIREFPMYLAPELLISLVNQNFSRVHFDEVVKAKKICIQHHTNLLAHVDGEPVSMGKEINIEVLPLSLKVLVPPKEMYQNKLLQNIRDLLPVV